MRFWLGTHHEHWLGLTEAELFISRRRLIRRKSFPEALSPWVLDSGAFSEIGQFGEWRLSEQAYVAEVRRYASEIGKLEWVAPMDWMCEPVMLKKTGLTVEEHQWRTTGNVLRLRDHLGELVVPVLQGWEQDDYLRHIELYEAAGFTLDAESVVGIGSVCKRQSSAEIEGLFRRLQCEGIRSHGFGVKTNGLARYADAIVSSDSLAWSYDARRSPPLPGHTHLNCANCLPWALRWRERVLEVLTNQQEVKR